MSVYYFDGAQILAPFTIRSNEPIFEVETVNLQKQRASQDVQRWELSFNTLGTEDTQVDIMLASLENSHTAQTMVMPQLPAVDNAITINTSSASMVGSTAVGANTTIIDPAGISGLIPKGTFFKFSSHDKIYVTTSDTTVGSTNVILGFYPKLQVAVTSSHTIQLKENAILTFYRDIDNQQGITFTDGVLSNVGSITLVEAL